MPGAPETAGESPAACLYDGHVMHARLAPKPHRFSYRAYNLAIDLDRLDDADAASRFFSVGRFNLLSFEERDHGDGAGGLAGYARRLLAEAGLGEEAERIVLLCYPRVLGFVFNPISVYFAFDRGGRTIGVIYEVRNTFGEMHSYAAPVAPHEATAAGLRQERAKLFHVSPFMGMGMTYRFRLRPPGEDVALRILECEGRRPMLAAAFFGRRAPMTDRGVAAACIRVPLLTLKVVAGINWEALKLWFKGIGFVAKPAAPPRTSAGGVFLGRTEERP